MTHGLEGGEFINSGATQLVAGNAIVTFVFARPLTSTYWELSIVPTGTNTNLEITRQFITSDPFGVRRLNYVVRNNVAGATAFTRGAIFVIPTLVVGPGLLARQFVESSSIDEDSTAEGTDVPALSISTLNVAYKEDGTISAISLPGGDSPASGEGLLAEEMNLPLEFRDLSPLELFEALRVDPDTRALTRAV